MPCWQVLERTMKDYRLPTLLRVLVVLCLTLGAASAAQAAITVVTSSSAGNGVSSSVSSLTLTSPGSPTIQSGDVLLAQVAVGTSSATINAPSGWSSFWFDTGSGVTQQAFYRVAGASEPVSYAFSFGSARASGGLLVLRGVDISGTTPIAHSQGNNGIGSTLTALAANVNTGNSLVVRYFAIGNGNNLINGPATQHYNPATGAGPNGLALSASSAIQVATGQSGNATASTSSSDSWLALTVVLAPSAQLVLQCFNDNFDRASLGADWATTTSGGSFGLPVTVGNRMRLTDNSGNVATAATLQRLFPAAGNYVQLQFKHYAYNGSGADGIAVVLSDANISPQAGSYGGPLGYGTRGTTAALGFAGGWLGVGVDEYGNFSTEGGGASANGPGQRPDSVAIRGSGASSRTSGYSYIAGTAANLSPGIDSAGSTAGPGYTYRITVDGRVTGKALVTVERNTGAGFSALSGLNAIDVLAATGQAALPQNFYLSLTGSSGGSTNTHELDDLQVCATQMNPVAQQIDHFEFVHAGNALTCNPLDVLVRACLDASCATTYNGSVSVNLQPAGWVGGDTQTFSGGSKTLQLRITNTTPVTLGVSSSTPVLKPLSQNLCSSGGALSSNCAVTFADSGFIFDVPTLIAAKPQSNIALRAVKQSDSSQSCVPGFAGVTRKISFTSAYTNPSSGSKAVIVNGSSVTTTPTVLDLSFDNAGSTPLTVRYDDAGQMTLNASYSGTVANGDNGLSMNGSDLFVAKPYGLCLQTDIDNLPAAQRCNSADISCPVFKAAGDSFPLRVMAVGWEADNEALTAAALCTGNGVTPNFQLNTIALSSQLQAPAGGSNGTLGVSSYNHALGSQMTLSTESISEVGVFTLTATPAANSYFGETVSGGTSNYIGRIIPAYLSASGTASLTPSCVNLDATKSFSYQGQPMAFAVGQEPNLSVSGKSRSGGTTSNYDRGSFWRLGTPARDAYLSVTGKTTLDASGRLLSSGSASVVQSGADNGDGARSYRWSGETLSYAPGALPIADDVPFTAAVRQGFSAAGLTDADGACYGNGSSCSSYSFDFTNTPGSQVRLGRLSLGNAHGSELQGLDLPLRIESWQNVAGGSFQVESQDSCSTAAVLGAPVLSAYTGNISAGETMASLSGPSAGLGLLRLSAPGRGNDGTVQGRLLTLPAWLYYDWDGTGDATRRRAAAGLASFGIYQGAPPLIFRRELYRSP